MKILEYPARLDVSKPDFDVHDQVDSNPATQLQRQARILNFCRSI